MQFIQVPVRAAITLAAILASTACAALPRHPRLSPHPTAIVDATVINPRAGAVTEHVTVLVRGDRITAIQSADAPVPRGFRQIDGRGGYIIPGLWDAHVHLSKLGSNSLPLFIANGVTGVRDMGGDLQELTAWRANIERRRLLGPRILLSGPMIESPQNYDRMRQGGGVEAVERQRVAAANPDEGRRLVRKLARAGVDQIKMRTTPDAQTFVAVADEAHRKGLPLAAHPLVTPEEMMTARLDSVEHYLTLPPLSASPESSGNLRDLFERMAAAGVHFSNTFANFSHLLTPYEQGLRVLRDEPGHGDPFRRYVCGYIVDDWREQLEETRTANLGSLLPMLPALYADVREMRAAGMPLLAGTDAAVMFVYPGFSMHEELGILVNDVGLSPMDALKIATNAVPAYFGKEDEWGGIEVGLAADFVLLDADPLEAIENTRRIRGVMARGVWFDRVSLDDSLTEVERDAATRCAGGSRAGGRSF